MLSLSRDDVYKSLSRMFTAAEAKGDMRLCTSLARIMQKYLKDVEDEAFAVKMGDRHPDIREALAK